MSVELKVPSVGESISEVYIGQWYKSEGDTVDQDEKVVELESEKATFDAPAPTAGVITQVLKKSGDMAEVGEVIAYIDPSGGGGTAKGENKTKGEKKSPSAEPGKQKPEDSGGEAHVMPAAARLLAEHGLQPEDVEGTGPGGRILKEDVLKHVKEAKPAKPAAEKQPAAAPQESSSSREEDVVPMSPIRRRIAQRLVSAQQSAALLTTFNEIDMSAIKQLREDYKDDFLKKHDVKLGFMSFFVKAVVAGLKMFPQVNAQIREDEIVFHNYYDIGIAIGGGKGLVVPILRNAERMGFAEIEAAIADFAARAKANNLGIDELRGGTFTISNGGIYGSLLSTPIVNPPQSGVLGMHAIQDRPVVVNGEIVIRPMMYVALTYDHRIVDGREAVTFLTSIKNNLESPARMLLEI